LAAPKRRSTLPHVHLAETLATQHGLITRRQALEAGMTVEALRHAIRPGGPWQRLGPGLYAAFTGQLSDRQKLQAALLVAGPDSMVSGADACRTYGMRYVPQQASPLVVVPAALKRRPPFVVVRRVAVVLQHRELAGLRVAPVARAVVDAARRDPVLHPDGLSLQDVRALVCESVQRKLTTPERLSEQLGQVRRNGSGHLRTAVDDVTAGCWSAPECELRDLIRSSRLLPEPTWNTPLPGLPHITPDGWWREARLVAEVDSDEYHRYGVTPEQTQKRHAEMIAAGWTVMGIAPRRIRRVPRNVLAELESAYRFGLGHGWV
jgi:hypothetical protein